MDELDKLVQWLSPFNHALVQNKLQETRQGTFKWLFQSQEFIDWENNAGRVLCGQGIAGAGKTYATSAIIHHLQERCRKNECLGIAYTYCNFQHHDEHSADDIITSFLCQLVYNRPEFNGLMADLCRKQDKLISSDIQAALHSVMGHFEQVFLIIDSLDPCRRGLSSDGLLDLCPSSRDELVAKLVELPTKNVSIFVTARSEAMDIQDYYDTVIVSRINIQATEDDVRLYLEAQMEYSLHLIKETPNLVEEVKETIVAASQGSFLVARLAFDSVRYLATISDVRDTIEKLKSGNIEVQPKEGDCRSSYALPITSLSGGDLTELLLSSSLAEPPVDSYVMYTNANANS